MQTRPEHVRVKQKHATELVGYEVGRMEQGLQTLNANKRTADWAERIRECRSSKMSVRNWCKENGLSEKTYYYWQRKLFQLVSEQQNAFAEITPRLGRRREQDIAATIRIGELEADIYAGSDAGMIEAVVHAMRSC